MNETLNGGKATVLEPGFVARVGRKLRSTLDVWFGPDLPMPPSAPVGTPPRTLDYPVGYNINIQPRNLEPISFAQMRALADSFDLVRLCIETRKDQVSRMPWAFRLKNQPGQLQRANNLGNTPISGEDNEEQDPRLSQLTEFFSYPDREHSWQQWVRLSWKTCSYSMRRFWFPSSIKPVVCGLPASNSMRLRSSTVPPSLEKLTLWDARPHR